MDHDNENSIGLVRADGTTKPELEVFEEFGRLTLALSDRLHEEPTLSEVCVIIPYRQWFTRDLLGRAGTQQATRILGYDLQIIPQLIGDNQLQILTEGYQPRLVILPGLQMIEKQAWQHLLTYVEAGGTLLVNGVITRDGHNLPFDPGLSELLTDQQLTPVSRYETLQLANGTTYQVLFGEEKISYLKKANNELQTLKHGRGTLFWCGLPLELASTETATRALYKQVLGLESKETGSTAILVRERKVDGGTLFLVVSEAGQPQQVNLGNNLTFTIEGTRAGALLIDENGELQTFGGLHR
jgi:hypothetical protein